MNTDQWQDQNNRYLAASLEWLRLRLLTRGPEPEILVTGPGAVSPPVIPPEPAPNRLSRWLGGAASPAPSAEPRLLSSGAPLSLEERIRAAAADRETIAAAMDPPPALLLLAERLALSPFERDTLLLCAAVEFDHALPAEYARVQGPGERPYPTFALALGRCRSRVGRSVAAAAPPSRAADRCRRHWSRSAHRRTAARGRTRRELSRRASTSSTSG